MLNLVSVAEMSTDLYLVVVADSDQFVTGWSKRQLVDGQSVTTDVSYLKQNTIVHKHVENI